MFLNPSSRESTLKPSHGLDAQYWHEVLKGDLTNISELRIKVTKGAFYDLLHATGNKFYFRHNSSSVSWSLGASVPDVASEFTFSDIVARLPDLNRQHSVWTGEPPQINRLLSLEVDDDNDRFEFEMPASAEGNVGAIFPDTAYSHHEIERQGDRLIIRTDRGAVPFFAQVTGALEIGNIVLCKRLPSGAYFTPLAASFMVSYILGMLCRYFPTSWIGIARLERGDAVYPLVIRLLDWILETYPAMIVDILRGPYEFEE